MNCKICNTKVDILFKKLVLNKYDVAYYQCPRCHFVQTENPYWLQEAYSDAISELDTGILKRNIIDATKTSIFIRKNFSQSEKIFLDYGAGIGTFVRLMRDLGHPFWGFDKYSKYSIASFFALDDSEAFGEGKKFTVISAFEVFEHLVNPLEEIGKLFQLTDTLIFSTNLIPKGKDLSSWWYLSTESGQHVSFYSLKAFYQLADYFDCYYYTNQKNFHVLSKKRLKNTVVLKRRIFFNKSIELAGMVMEFSRLIFSKTSLTDSDREMIKARMFDRNK